jgi:hypothetical protein
LYSVAILIIMMFGKWYALTSPLKHCFMFFSVSHHAFFFTFQWLVCTIAFEKRICVLLKFRTLYMENRAFFYFFCFSSFSSFAIDFEPRAFS